MAKKFTTKSTRIQFTPAAVDRALRAAEAGGTYGEIAKAVGCHLRTLYKWMETHAEFADQLDRAMTPDSCEEEIARLELRKQWCEDWIDTYLRTQGEQTIESWTTGDHTLTKKKGIRPDMRLIDRVLGVGKGETIKVEISVANPDHEDDEPLLDEIDFTPEGLKAF